MDLEVYDNYDNGQEQLPVLTPDEQLQALGYVARQRYGLDEKDMKPRPDERQQRAISLWVLERYDFLRVTSTCRYYYRRKDDTSMVFTPVSVREDRTLRNMVKEGYRAFNIAYTATKIKNTVETLKEYVEMEKDSIDQDMVEISKGWYWDVEAAKITNKPTKPCFVKLFDNSGHDVKEKFKIDSSEIVVPITKKICQDALKWLEKNDGILPLPKNGDTKETYIADGMPELPYFKFIDTWACGNEGVYNDILKATSAMFMKNKPIGAFILTGLMRNGKSTYVKMLHMIMGRANTSSVRLTELHDPHKNLTLLGTFLNAPDEEVEGKDLSEEATADFKSMAAHEELVLPVMYSAEPQPISTDFVMFCPMNDDPEWKGNSASACTQRSLIIPFYADLSKMDNSGHDFVAETFTPCMFQSLLGVLFAFATYYRDRRLTFSSTMEKERVTASELSDSRVAFANLFCKWFVGYSNENIVFDEYKSWCDYYGYQYAGKRKLMFAIDKVAHGRSRTRVVIKEGDEPQPAIRLGGKPGDEFFADEYEIKAFKRTVGSIVYTEKYFASSDRTRSGKSVIVALEEWLAKNQMRKAQD